MKQRNKNASTNKLIQDRNSLSDEEDDFYEDKFTGKQYDLDSFSNDSGGMSS